ncbi:hypothetical protein GCM10027317_12800 [Massilia agri]
MPSQLNQAVSTGVPIQSGWDMAWSRVMGVDAAAGSARARAAAKRDREGVRIVIKS